MTKRTFDILDYCTTWLNPYRWGIFQDQWLRSVWSVIPENDNDLYKGMWLFVDAEADIVFRATEEMADNVLIYGEKRYLFLYRLE